MVHMFNSANLDVPFNLKSLIWFSILLSTEVAYFYIHPIWYIVGFQKCLCEIKLENKREKKEVEDGIMRRGPIL